MKCKGTIKTIFFKGNRCGVLLEEAQYLSKEGIWKSLTMSNGNWISTFDNIIAEHLKELSEGDKVEVDAFRSAGKQGKGEFWNIRSIGLEIPEIQVKEDMEDAPPDIEEEPEFVKEVEDAPKIEDSKPIDKDTEIRREALYKAACDVAKSFEGTYTIPEVLADAVTRILIRWEQTSFTTMKINIDIPIED